MLLPHKTENVSLSNEIASLEKPAGITVGKTGQMQGKVQLTRNGVTRALLPNEQIWVTVIFVLPSLPANAASPRATAG
jgi:hypothetical protein